eukprot:TRINITY_DN1834_c0_g1_i1.p1 TRINITY_DN1834_c0_g1~~TRINITY_DN1834_c0_g1_i1.p1  ORF type:complete len:310 (+),score=103.11 TRINITY_DN1834_c0_g1_i1:69-932(+)
MAAHRTFAVAVDGSDISAKGFDVTLSILKRADDHKSIIPDQDKVVVIHVYDRSKIALPEQFRPERIRSHFETLCVGQLPANNYRVVTVENHESKTRETLCRAVQEEKADYLVMGFFGRKGPKEDPSVMGSTADFSIRAANTTAILIKHTAPVPSADEPVRFVVGLDGSERSYRALQAAVNLSKPSDTMVLLHVYSPREAHANTHLDIERIKSRSRQICSAAPQLTTKFELLEGNKITQTLMEYINNGDFHFLAIGADGQRASNENVSSIGSVSDSLAKKSLCHVIIA